MSQINVDQIFDSAGGGKVVLNGVLNTPLGWRNKVINGDMLISQRGSSFTAPGNGTFVFDRWWVNNNGAITNIDQNADVPANNEFAASLRATVATARAATAAADFQCLCTTLEGSTVRDFIGKPFTLSFWVRSPKVGIHCLGFIGTSQSYVCEYTVNAVNTWEYKSVTCSGLLIGNGNWTNGAGFSIRFALQAGTQFQTAKDSWQTIAGGAFATSNQVNCVDTVGNVFALTGVQVEAGSKATPFEHRPGSVEQYLCSRYFLRHGFNIGSTTTTIGRGVSSGGNAIWRVGVPLIAPMRVNPIWVSTGLNAWTTGAGSVSITGFTNYSTFALGGIYNVEADVSTSGPMSTAGMVAMLQTAPGGGTSFLDLNADLL